MTEATGNHNGDSPSRLDRIEALLEAGITQHNREMAGIRASHACTQMLIEQNAAGLRETRAIADSNARSVQSWETRMEQGES